MLVENISYRGACLLYFCFGETDCVAAKSYLIAVRTEEGVALLTCT